MSYNASKSPCLTIMHGKDVTVLEMEHQILDFVVLCKNLWSYGKSYLSLLAYLCHFLYMCVIDICLSVSLFNIYGIDICQSLSLFNIYAVDICLCHFLYMCAIDICLSGSLFNIYVVDMSLSMSLYSIYGIDIWSIIVTIKYLCCWHVPISVTICYLCYWHLPISVTVCYLCYWHLPIGVTI